MSLLLDLIQQLLEYLNIPVDRLVPIWENYANRQYFLHVLRNHLPLVLPGINLQVLERLENKEYGWTRSVVRVIGTLLPLAPTPRPFFQHVTGPYAVEGKSNGAVSRPGIPSLVDVYCLTDDDVYSYTRFRHHLPGNRCEEMKSLAPSYKRKLSWEPTIINRAPDTSLPPSSENAIQKIAALEGELLQLRAQIAAIVAIQDTKSMQSCSETLSSFGSPTHDLLQPSLTSTPLSGQILQPVTPAPPPPPPPPPPPAPPSKVNTGESAIELIRKRKAVHKKSPKERAMVDNTNNLPSMMDVLKGMKSIQLRAVERSPGGTPLTRKDKKRRSLDDPAAIIANALKQKFAHRLKNDSFDKENISHEESPFSSPEIPQFGRHLLKPVGKQTGAVQEGKQVLVKPGPHV
ncbi:mitochondrial fission regulator 2 [Xenopus laevis]|uniref:Mitochondrial fission regulator n=2 Tax=Xenopus laevis TaxID=8355 RepID=A0A1L8G971_XENLA|nr:mitochondrial fission regulator 2 [Xenopus laevis]XP_018118739.1 mitochondrial fission regulator 2 [Xenopus laevis]OCT80291.1 hypothetical protein XELAEV_18027109mg [Xenopus laevis]